MTTKNVIWFIIIMFMLIGIIMYNVTDMRKDMIKTDLITKYCYAQYDINVSIGEVNNLQKINCSAFEGYKK